MKLIRTPASTGNELKSLDQGTKVSSTATAVVQQKGLPLEDKAGGGGQRTTVPSEPLVELPPSGAGGSRADAMRALGKDLKTIADGMPTGEAKKIYEDSARAAEQVAKMSAVGTPVRFSIRKDKNRPEKMVGFVERTIAGPEDNRRAETLFRPKDSAFRPFAIPTSAVEGLRSGAKIELDLERTETGAQTYLARFTESELATSFVATVEVQDGKAFAVGIKSAPVFSKVALDDSAKALAGQEVIVSVEHPEAHERTGKIAQVVGAPDDVASKILEGALMYGVSPSFSAEAMAEVKQIQAMKIEGKDYRSLPFVTIDNVDSMDLDQAMCIKKRPDGGFDLHYAIADVAYFVKPGMALDREAKRRSETSYIEGRALGMLPKELSEDKISLLPNVDRRAFIVTVSMDKSGKVIGQSFDRGVIQSRAKLAYSGVQSWIDAGKKGAMTGKDYTETLELLESLGKLRVSMAEKRGVVPSDVDERPLHLDKASGKVIVGHEVRLTTEKWNEQISLLANEAVGKELREAGLKALYRTHPEP
ncbi:MAG: RNB domain-containing ribonuclease, partial [Myxococcota bacterium]